MPDQHEQSQDQSSPTPQGRPDDQPESAPRGRHPYVKPLVQALPYMVDQHVSLAASCKTTGSATGPTVAGCKSIAANVPCVTLGS